MGVERRVDTQAQAEKAPAATVPSGLGLIRDVVHTQSSHDYQCLPNVGTVLNTIESGQRGQGMLGIEHLEKKETWKW